MPPSANHTMRPTPTTAGRLVLSWFIRETPGDDLFGHGEVDSLRRRMRLVPGLDAPTRARLSRDPVAPR